MRLYPENIKSLFKQVSVGTKVRIVTQPYLIGWHNGMLYLEASEPLQEKAKSTKRLSQSVIKKLKDESKLSSKPIDWKMVSRVLDEARGIPTPILQQTGGKAYVTMRASTVAHPYQFYGKPLVPRLTPSDWAALAGIFRNETEAEKLAEILIHQGPSIPARVKSKAGNYQVILGPFRNRTEAVKVKKRIRRDFDIQAKLIEPLRKL